MTTTLRTSGIQMGDSVMDVSGSAPSGLCRAWVKFYASGSIYASSGVSSVTRNGTGNWNVNWSVSFGNNYVGLVLDDYAARQTIARTNGLTATYMGVINAYIPSNSGNTLYDDTPMFAAAFSRN